MSLDISTVTTAGTTATSTTASALSATSGVQYGASASKLGLSKAISSIGIAVPSGAGAGTGALTFAAIGSMLLAGAFVSVIGLFSYALAKAALDVDT